jgi:hypothetical protein
VAGFRRALVWWDMQSGGAGDRRSKRPLEGPTILGGFAQLIARRGVLRGFRQFGRVDRQVTFGSDELNTYPDKRDHRSWVEAINVFANVGSTEAKIHGELPNPLSEPLMFN